MPINITKVNMPAAKVNIKCPYTMQPIGVVIHNTANDASAMSEISYMIGNSKQCSFHFAVDDERAVQGIDFNRNSWNAGDGGNGAGNRKYISIEICYSKSGGERYYKAQDNAAELTAMILKQFGWGVEVIKQHHDFSGKHCPHRMIDEDLWPAFIAKVKSFMTPAVKPVVPAPAPAKPVAKPVVTKPVILPKPDVVYSVFAGRWFGEIKNYDENPKNSNGYAGVERKAMTGLKARVSRGNLSVRVYTKGRYLAWVKNNDAKQGGYAGLLGNGITRVQMHLDSCPGYAVEYRVSLVGSNNYLAWVRDYNNSNGGGYAGSSNCLIDKIQVRIVKL